MVNFTERYTVVGIVPTVSDMACFATPVYRDDSSDARYLQSGRERTIEEFVRINRVPENLKKFNSNKNRVVGDTAFLAFQNDAMSIRVDTREVIYEHIFENIRFFSEDNALLHHVFAELLSDADIQKLAFTIKTLPQDVANLISGKRDYLFNSISKLTRVDLSKEHVALAKSVRSFKTYLPKLSSKELDTLVKLNRYANINYPNAEILEVHKGLDQKIQSFVDERSYRFKSARSTSNGPSIFDILAEVAELLNAPI